MRASLIILFVSIFNLSFSQISGVVYTGGYLYSSTEANVNKTITYFSDGQSILIYGRSKENSNYLVVAVNNKKGYMYYSAIKNSSAISKLQKMKIIFRLQLQKVKIIQHLQSVIEISGKGTVLE